MLDIRSRLIRLSDCSTVEASAVQQLLMHRYGFVFDEKQSSEKSVLPISFLLRLPSQSNEALKEWLDILTGRHALWKNISEAYKVPKTTRQRQDKILQYVTKQTTKLIYLYLVGNNSLISMSFPCCCARKSGNSVIGISQIIIIIKNRIRRRRRRR